MLSLTLQEIVQEWLGGIIQQLENIRLEKKQSDWLILVIASELTLLFDNVRYGPRIIVQRGMIMKLVKLLTCMLLFCFLALTLHKTQ